MNYKQGAKYFAYRRNGELLSVFDRDSQLLWHNYKDCKMMMKLL